MARNWYGGTAADYALTPAGPGGQKITPMRGDEAAASASTGVARLMATKIQLDFSFTYEAA